jgi:septum site-determining protein MinD
MPASWNVRYDAARAARGEMLSIENVFEILSVPLLGVVPESEEVLRASNVGALVALCNGAGPAARAYNDAARRLRGETLPITIPSDQKRLFSRIFRRRAA